ncbi:MAG: DUF2769 domain-containing protein [Nitrospirae bacterium]|nr:DUF2769 domain-containing protein [Nitrospirota bacterium]
MPKVDDNQDNVNVCLKFCGPCLTYPDVEGEALFCARGKSSAPKAKQGCNCGICDVKRKYLCQGAYFCINGACE